MGQMYDRVVSCGGIKLIAWTGHTGIFSFHTDPCTVLACMSSPSTNQSDCSLHLQRYTSVRRLWLQVLILILSVASGSS